MPPSTFSHQTSFTLDLQRFIGRSNVLWLKYIVVSLPLLSYHHITLWNWNVTVQSQRYVRYLVHKNILSMENKILSQVHHDIDTDLHILHLLISTSCLFPLIHCNGLEKLKGKILLCAWLHTDELHWVNMVGFVTHIFRALWSFTYCYRVEKGKGQLDCLMQLKSKFLWNDSFLSLFSHWRMSYKEWKIVL